MTDGDAERTAVPDTEDIFGIGRPIGEILRDFRLLSKLGEGGMGLVYKAHQLSLDQDVALKILAPELTENHAFVTRFYREARMSVQLKGNASIVHGIAVGFACAVCAYNGPPEEHAVHGAAADRHRGIHYFAMEFVEGDNLAEWLTRLRHLSVGDAVKIAIDVAQALEYAHSRKRPIFHRDVKPANIMVTPDGDVRLADLGLAKAAEDDGGLTQIGEMAGTPAFMPPEQARNAAMADGRSDIYALGATLYVMLTGQNPFPGKTMVDIVEAKERGKFESAHSINIAVSAPLDRILAKMLAPDPGNRYQTAAQVVAALADTGLASKYLAFLDSGATITAPLQGVIPQPDTGARRWRLRTLAAISALIPVVAALYLAGIHLLPSRSGVNHPVPGPSGDPVDTVLARAMERVENGDRDGARESLVSWLRDHPGDQRIVRPLSELERGALVLFQHQTPAMTSPLSPIWAATEPR